MPEVPTIVESSYPNHADYNWLGIFAKAATPSAIVARLDAELVKAVRDSRSSTT